MLLMTHISYKLHFDRYIFYYMTFNRNFKQGEVKILTNGLEVQFLLKLPLVILKITRAP